VELEFGIACGHRLPVRVLMIQVKLPGVGSVLPAASVALTVKGVAAVGETRVGRR